MKMQKIRFVSTFLILILVCGGGHVEFAQSKGTSESPAQRRQKAKELFKKGFGVKELREKEAFYIQALEIWPGYPEAHNNLGDVYEKQERYEEAIREYTIATVLKPYLSVPYFGLGDVHFELGRYERAVDAYQKGLAIDPTDTISQENLLIARALISKILFDFDSDQLTEEAISQLRRVANALFSQQLSKCIFEIQGHTDSMGPREYNLRLSLRRAQSIKRYLVNSYGIQTDRLIIKGYGEDRPTASNDTEEARAMNRRAEFARIREP